MQFHEAKIIRTLKGAPRHMRDEAERILNLHAALVEADRKVNNYGQGQTPRVDCHQAHEFATLDPGTVLRTNKVLVFNLLLACRSREWLPAWGTNV